MLFGITYCASRDEISSMVDVVNYSVDIISSMINPMKHVVDIITKNLWENEQSSMHLGLIT